MKKGKIRFLTTIIWLFCASVGFARSISIFSQTDISQVQFAVCDLQHETRITLGLYKNSALREQLNLSNEKFLETTTEEPYSIKLTQNDGRQKQVHTNAIEVSDYGIVIKNNLKRRTID
ncbi:MAG: hypothetical protein ABJN84_11885 [Flavobacteriaceae bacterium]